MQRGTVPLPAPPQGARNLGHRASAALGTEAAWPQSAREDVAPTGRQGAFPWESARGGTGHQRGPARRRRRHVGARMLPRVGILSTYGLAGVWDTGRSVKTPPWVTCSMGYVELGPESRSGAPNRVRSARRRRAPARPGAAWRSRERPYRPKRCHQNLGAMLRANGHTSSAQSWRFWSGGDEPCVRERQSAWQPWQS